MGCITLSYLSIILGIRAGLPDRPSRVGACLVRPSSVGAACSPWSRFTLSFGSMKKMMHFHVTRFWNCSVQLPYPPCYFTFLHFFSQNICSDFVLAEETSARPSLILTLQNSCVNARFRERYWQLLFHAVHALLMVSAELFCQTPQFNSVTCSLLPLSAKRSLRIK